MTNNKIFIDYRNNRFINGLIGSSPKDLQILHSSINKNIYNIYYSLNFDYCIFNLSSIDNEIIQFISEYASTVKIFIYLDVPNYTDVNLIDAFKNSVYYLIPENTFHHYQNYDNVIKINNNLVNTKIFYMNNNITRDAGSICVFLDLFESIPEPLIDKLYPKTKLKIMMYNNPNIKHAQNLGVLSEMDKAYVLNKSTYFIDYNNYYTYEAISCGCKILNINNIDAEHCININHEITNYDHFVKEYIL